MSGEISELILHPDWDHKSKHFKADIAIAVLKEPVIFTSDIRKICLTTPSQPIKNFANQIATVAGWGYTETSNKTSVSDLREVKVPIAEQSLCDASKRLQRYNADTLFCAGSRDNLTGPCRGNF
jgi:hypothetical protein